MEYELNNNQNHTVDALRNLIKELTSKNVSILQVANDKTGVISLNEKDCLWIEQLSQASLINNEEQYFITLSGRMLPFGNIEPIFRERFTYSGGL
ncbi:unnamed protein product [Rotaria sp. Silwood2]|nr:unnamed protein product [Rotaria sp. Silwood2]CAF4454920.1 unnamed protein product [Rotaria sp. Silwood2]